MTESIRTGYKILTHDWRPPVHGGEPLCDGLLPVTLPLVELDLGPKDCSKGYNYTGSLCDAAKIASFWPTGRPARCLIVSASDDAIQRQTKRRCSQLTLERLCTDSEIKQAMRDLVIDWAKVYTEALVQEQWLWYKALGRPHYDKGRVVELLQVALKTRGLDWTLREFASARGAREAWAAREARGARGAWAPREARGTWAARRARGARAVRGAWEAWEAWEARGAWEAWEALTFHVAVSFFDLPGYTADFLTLGIRDAYLYGLNIAIPTGPSELGWAMVELPENLGGQENGSESGS